jgi:hypothetical protein
MDAIRRNYFPLSVATEKAELVAVKKEIPALDASLFVKQLEAAGRIENDAAKGLFFAAEALARDLAARGDRSSIAALDELHLEIHSLWEAGFNARVDQADGDGKIAGLIEATLSEAANHPDPEGLRLRPAHRKGIAHRLVEDARAGWVRHWREVATNHTGPSARDLLVGQEPDTEDLEKVE